MIRSLMQIVDERFREVEWKDPIVKQVWGFFELFFQFFLEKRINSYAFIRHLGAMYG
jgi:hypothetical protein